MKYLGIYSCPRANRFLSERVGFPYMNIKGRPLDRITLEMENPKILQGVRIWIKSSNNQLNSRYLDLVKVLCGTAPSHLLVSDSKCLFLGHRLNQLLLLGLINFSRCKILGRRNL